MSKKPTLADRVEGLEYGDEELRHFIFRELLGLRALVGRPLCVECARGWADRLGIYDDFFEEHRGLMVAIHMDDVTSGNPTHHLGDQVGTFHVVINERRRCVLSICLCSVHHFRHIAPCVPARTVFMHEEELCHL
jgi:hypothetical protein